MKSEHACSSSLQRTHRAANKMVVSGDGDDDVHSVAKKYMTHTPSYFAVLLFSLKATSWAMLPLLFDSVFFLHAIHTADQIRLYRVLENNFERCMASQN